MANAMINARNQLAILNEQHKGLKAKDALQLMNENEEFAISAIPVRPQGGQVYLYQPLSTAKKDDWKSDGHIWSCEGVRKLEVGGINLTKRHFKILLGYEGKKRILENGFVKHVYQKDDDNTILIHYIGDHNSSEPRSHGNATKGNKFCVVFQK